jgi:hypothetical protein
MSFTTLGPSDFVVSTDSITAPAWSSNVPVLRNFYSYSGSTTAAPNATAITQDAFYLNVFNAPLGSSSASIQFAIAYGDQLGSGSLPYNSLVPGVTPSLTTYNQYNTLIYGPAVSSSTQGFNFGGAATNAQTIFAINVDRNRYKETLFPGTFNLALSGSGGQITITDNSNATTVVNYLDCGRVFDLVSGSNGTPATTNSTLQTGNGYTQSGSYGMYLPDIGVILLNASALALPGGSGGGIGLVLDRSNYTSTVSTNTALYTSSINNNRLFTAISGGYNITTGVGGFQLNSQENVSSDYIFCRLSNQEYNYSANPTFVTGSGNLLFPSMVYNPQTYVTTVGLYNNNSELLAVAKLSRPLVKDFTKEALIRVKLDW